MNIIFTLGLPNSSTGYYNNLLPDLFFNTLKNEDQHHMIGLYKSDMKNTITIWINDEKKIPIGHSKGSIYHDLILSFEDKLINLPYEIKNTCWFKTTYYISCVYFKSFIETNNIDINDVIHNSGLFIQNEFRNQRLAKKLIKKRMDYFINKVMLCFTINSYAHRVFQSCNWINMAYVDYNIILNHFNIKNEKLKNDRINLWVYIGSNLKDKYNITNLTYEIHDLSSNIINYNLI